MVFTRVISKKSSRLLAALLVAGSFFLSPSITKAQPEAEVDLVTTRGGEVQFNVVRLNHYRNGFTYNARTIFGFHVENRNGAPEPDRLVLKFRTITGDFTSNAGNTVDKNRLRVRAQNEQNLPAGGDNTYTGWQTTQNTFTTLFEHDFSPFSSFDWTMEQVHIDYEAGAGPNDFIGEQPGFYTLQLRFRLEATF